MWADLRFRLRALLHRDAMDRELRDELSFHIEQEVAKHLRSGMPRAEAERRARAEFGRVERIVDETRAVRGVARLDAVFQDVRYAWRGVRARPGFAAAVVLTLGLGIGANTAMFGVVDRLLLRPPAFLEAADRVHRVYLERFMDGREATERQFEYLGYEDVKRYATAFDRVAASAYRILPVGSGGNTRDAVIAPVSASYFDFFDARPILGRFFTAEEDAAPAGVGVAVVGYRFWRSALGGRRDVLGDQLHIGEARYTIIGVAPQGFAGVTDGPAPAAFIPISAFGYARRQDYAHAAGWTWLEVLVRRKPDVPIDAATADLTAAFTRSREARRGAGDELVPSDARLAAVLAPVHAARGPDAGSDGKVATWVMGVAAAVLLIAAANIANLLLARAVDRRREIAVRRALGVSRSRLVQQLLVETLLLALLGGVAGVLLAQWGGGSLRGLFLGEDAAAGVATDPRSLFFAATLTLSLALLTGLAPALHASREDVAGRLKAGRLDSGDRGSALRTSLLLVQGVLCVLLLVGAGLFVRSLLNVQRFRLGYDVETVALVDGNLRGVQLRDAERTALADRLLTAAASVPGVRGATLVASVPFAAFEGRGAPYVPGRDSLYLLGRFTLQAGSPSYFEVTGTRIVRGRAFAPTDGAHASIIVVSQSMADAVWPAQDPIGKHVRVGADSLPMLTVVGVAEDVTDRRIGAEPDFWYYLSVAQYRAMFGATRPNLAVRVNGRAVHYVEPIRARLQREMPGDAYVRVMPLQDLIAPQQRSWRAGATMFVTFAALALVLAAVGLYSLLAYGVAHRTREIGIRIALGASAAAVVGTVARQSLLFAIIGIVGGGAAAWIAARRIEPLLFAVSPHDPLVFGTVAGVLLAVTFSATILPALRASRIDPKQALSAE